MFTDVAWSQMTKVHHGLHFLNPTVLVFNTEPWLMTSWDEMLFLLSNPAFLESSGPCLFRKPSHATLFSDSSCPHSTHYTARSFTVLLCLACLDCELFGNHSLYHMATEESRLSKHFSYLFTGFSLVGWQLKSASPHPRSWS